MKKLAIVALVLLSLLVAGCGNKGPLVKPSQMPPPVDGGNN
ncbi:MAG: lipoprotein [Luteimonas sp.]